MLARRMLLTTVARCMAVSPAPARRCRRPRWCGWLPSPRSSPTNSSSGDMTGKSLVDSLGSTQPSLKPAVLPNFYDKQARNLFPTCRLRLTTVAWCTAVPHVPARPCRRQSWCGQVQSPRSSPTYSPSGDTTSTCMSSTRR